MGEPLGGRLVTLRPATEADVPALAAIRRTPEVYAWWRGGEDLERELRDDLADDESQTYAILYDQRVVGAIQWSQETDPDYRHASIDIYLDPSVHGRGLGTDAVRTLARHLLTGGGTTASPSTRPRPTTRPSARTRRSASSRSGSCAGTSAGPTGAGTTAC